MHARTASLWLTAYNTAADTLLRMQLHLHVHGASRLVAHTASILAYCNDGRIVIGGHTLLDQPLHFHLVTLFHGGSELTIERHLHLRQVSVHRVQYVPARV